jgi:hypothetical protein
LSVRALKKYLGLMVMVVASGGAFADVRMAVDTNALERNLSACADDVIKSKEQKGIDYLKKPVVEDVEAFFAGTGMIDYVMFSQSEACSVGLLDNAMIILQAYRDAGGREFNADAKRELARAKLMKSAFQPMSQRKVAYDEAEKLISDFFAEIKPVSAGDKLGAAYGLVAYGYLDAAKLTSDESRLYLLDKAIAVAKLGVSQKISSQVRAALEGIIGTASDKKVRRMGGA